jgi:excisionase family DNA binding protein
VSAPSEALDLDALPLALPVKTVAALTNMSTDALYECIAAGTCPWPVLRVGRVIRIPRAAVLESLGLDDGAAERDAHTPRRTP